MGWAGVNIVYLQKIVVLCARDGNFESSKEVSKGQELTV